MRRIERATHPTRQLQGAWRRGGWRFGRVGVLGDSDGERFPLTPHPPRVRIVSSDTQRSFTQPLCSFYAFMQLQPTLGLRSQRQLISKHRPPLGTRSRKFCILATVFHDRCTVLILPSTSSWQNKTGREIRGLKSISLLEIIPLAIYTDHRTVIAAKRKGQVAESNLCFCLLEERLNG